MKNCDNFRDFRPFHGRQSIVKKCDEIGAMGQTMVFHAPVRVSFFLFVWSPGDGMPGKVPTMRTGARSRIV